MNLDSFLTSQRDKLEADKERLILRPLDNSYLNEFECISKKEKSTKNCNEVRDQQKQCNKNAIMDFQPQVVDPLAAAGVLKLQQKAERESSIATQKQNVQQAKTESVVFQNYDELNRKYIEPNHENPATKTAKELANSTQRQGTGIVSRNRKLHKNKDEMEQWVSDTFYSYFPGFNNENKRRQDILRERQLEYQQNFLKHQMTEAAANSGKKKYPHSFPRENIENPPDSIQKPLTSRSDKTDLEIIVNNPDYEGKSPRPGSARHKLLQDLKHTEISKIVNSDGVTERNRYNAELEMAKKKDYQKELMAQIEEKRRSIEVLKEKERQQEEALTRKLQEQLKTMRLEEDLEKEKMLADKVRFDSEQNRLMREHLLTKLENDSKLLCSARKPRSENDKVAPPENKVYKYFSNSARHEYRHGTMAPPAFHLDLPQSSSHHKECFHTNDICPFCSSSLKSYENWCLKCEKKIAMTAETDLRHLICENCQKQYSVCVNCDKTDESNCFHCERKRNICVNCRRTLCSDCVDAIAMEKDKQKTDSERSFQILEMNYPEESDEDINNNSERSFAPYSINIDRNSIFHHNFNHSKLFDDQHNIEAIRHETDKRLSRYLKNYGDLASTALRNRSTQTTPDSASRRDVVMMEENNLSMPLLREMPRMTRKESNLQQTERKKKGTRIENLARRWECAQGRAAWLERGRRCSVQDNNPTACHRRWVKRNRIQDASLGGSSDDEDFLGVLRGPSTFANAFLYVGLGTIALGLVIAFVGTGEKGFKTVELRLIGPSLIGLGLICCILRILFCICPSHCLSSSKNARKKQGNKVDADHTTSLLRGESKRVSIARGPHAQKYPITHKRSNSKMLNEGMEALRQIATTSLFLQNEQKPSMNRVVPIIKEPEKAVEAPLEMKKLVNALHVCEISDDEDNDEDEKTSRVSVPVTCTSVINEKPPLERSSSKLSRQRVSLNQQHQLQQQQHPITPTSSESGDLLMETSLMVINPTVSSSSGSVTIRPPTITAKAAPPSPPMLPSTSSNSESPAVQSMSLHVQLNPAINCNLDLPPSTPHTYTRAIVTSNNNTLPPSPTPATTTTAVMTMYQQEQQSVLPGQVIDSGNLQLHTSRTATPILPGSSCTEPTTRTKPNLATATTNNSSSMSGNTLAPPPPMPSAAALNFEPELLLSPAKLGQ